MNENILNHIKAHQKQLGEISVNQRQISETAPVFVIAEAACNHMCDLSLAKKMIDAAKDAGADAIKFQTYKAEKLVTKQAQAFWGKETVSQVEYYKRLDRFGPQEYADLFDYASKRNIIAFSSPFDSDSARMLHDLGMPLFKVASCDLPDLRNLRLIAGFGKPVILSTGASTIEEIDRAVETFFDQGNNQLMLMACTLSYPTQNKDANLMRIRTLKNRYPGMLIGLSDHTEPDPNMVIPTVATTLGARMIEKHFTLDRTMTGSGHFFAVDPACLDKMVQNIRLSELVLGNGELGVAPSEKNAWESARRKIVAETRIEKGCIIRDDMLGVKRPGNGLPASMLDKVVGRKAVQTIEPDQAISLDMIE